VTRQIEPEWDDLTRARVEGLARYENEVHSEGCGLHPSIIADPKRNALKIEEDFCPVCARLDVYARVQAELDEQHAPKDPSGQPLPWPARDRHPSDGRRVFMRPKTADEIAAQRTRRRPHG